MLLINLLVLCMDLKCFTVTLVDITLYQIFALISEESYFLIMKLMMIMQKYYKVTQNELFIILFVFDKSFEVLQFNFLK